jgi:DNA end-binding protein Ku
VPERDEIDASDEGRGRAFWSGILSFGLVSIPVELLPAHRGNRASLRMVDAEGTPLARRYHCPAHEQPVDADQIARGYELDNGKIVLVTDEEREALAPKKSREIDLRRFVDRDSIDPLYFQRSYFLAPGANSGKAYRLLGAVMERSRRAGIATFVMRDKEYLIAIFAEAGLLRAETLRFHDEVRSPRDVGLPKAARVDASALARLSRSVSALEAEKWDPSALVDAHEPIRALAERKYKQRKDVITSSGAPARDAEGQVVDLFEVLRQSLAENDLAAKRAPNRSTSGRAKPKKKASKAAASAAAARRSPTRSSAKSGGRRKKSAARRR